LAFFLTKVDPLIPAAERESIAKGVTYLRKETTETLENYLPFETI
jgi:hypothetical protein